MHKTNLHKTIDCEDEDDDDEDENFCNIDSFEHVLKKSKFVLATEISDIVNTCENTHIDQINLPNYTDKIQYQIPKDLDLKMKFCLVGSSDEWIYDALHDGIPLISIASDYLVKYSYNGRYQSSPACGIFSAYLHWKYRNVHKNPQIISSDEAMYLSFHMGILGSKYCKEICEDVVVCVEELIGLVDPDEFESWLLDLIRN